MTFDSVITTFMLRAAMVMWKVINAARQSGWAQAAAALCMLAICIGSLLPESERVEGTAATVAIAVYKGARLVRVHDVVQMERVVRMTEAIRSGDIGSR